MTEPEEAEKLAVQASSSEREPPDGSGTETPMLAVWLSLAAILLAGLYGLYLGAANKSNQKSSTATTSHYVLPEQAQVRTAALDTIIRRRLS